jgi:hypothetical protein
LTSLNIKRFLAASSNLSAYLSSANAIFVLSKLFALESSDSDTLLVRFFNSLIASEMISGPLVA